MKIKQFKCTLISDVIINVKAASEGNQQTLDFIPGSSFLGVAAGAIPYDILKSEEAMLVFHSGKVRFGDAHPLSFNGREYSRTYRIPASWYYVKDQNFEAGLYVHHAMPRLGLHDSSGNPVQIKQCRTGYIARAGENKFREIRIKKEFAIKSAYNTEKRRSEDEQMYGYESMSAGSVWGFELLYDDDVSTELITRLSEAITGKKKIGRSSTAQYGLVEIEPATYTPGFATGLDFSVDGDSCMLMYAESRLIFIDDDGQPTFEPCAGPFGLSKGAIDYGKSQIRTFRYAPYNFKRQTFDAERCGIEKGSVICITGAGMKDLDKDKVARGVGSYINEGFGRVLVNPEFLRSQENDATGKAIFSPASAEPENAEAIELPDKLKHDDLVYQYLRKEKTEKDLQQEIYSNVNDYVTRNASYFRGEKFASQWGTIRTKAVQSTSKNDILEALFKTDEGYLVHGVAREQWEGPRIRNLEKFVRELNEKSAVRTMINLAAEMAKKCK